MEDELTKQMWGGKKNGKKRRSSVEGKVVHRKEDPSRGVGKSNSIKKKDSSKLEKRYPDELRNSSSEPKLVWEIRVNKRLQRWMYFAIYLNDEFVQNIALENKAFKDFKKRLET